MTVNCITVKGGNPIHGDPRGSNTHTLTKMTQNSGILQITSLLDHSTVQSNHKYTLRTNHDGIPSKLIE